MLNMPNRAPVPLLLVLLAVAASAIGLTACQGGESEDNTSGGQTLNLKADPDGAPRFLRQLFFAKPGKTTIEFTNESSTAHNVTIVGPVTANPTSNGFEPVVGPDTETQATETITNSSTSVTVELQLGDQKRAGQYYFHCSVDGHEAAGMRGLIIVREQGNS